MRPSEIRELCAPLVVLVAMSISAFPLYAATQEPIGSTIIRPEFAAKKVFFMLFLMLGPIKVLVPFVELTRELNRKLQRRLATRSILFATAALMLAALLGRTIIEKFEISLAVLALTGGIILFLVALQTVLQQSRTVDSGQLRPSTQGQTHLAVSPLAFPIIVAPYGIAAVIVFATLAQGQHSAELILVGMVCLILALDWFAMLFAEQILRRVGTALQVFGVVLGVTQIALGVQIILESLDMMGFIPRV